MTCFYIVRHGQTLLNQLDRAQGWADSPLTGLGEQAAKDLGEHLSAIPFSAAYTSDTKRAFQTARLILEKCRQLDIEIYQDERLREWCLGMMEAERNPVFIQNVSEWLGGVSSFLEMNKRLPDVAQAIRQHDTTGTTESFLQIGERLAAALKSASIAQAPESNILIVTHAFAMKTLIYLFAPERMEQNIQIQNAGIIKLLYDGEKFKME